MSKNLIKILSICAFVILLPVIIIAVALSVTGTRLCNLTLDISGANNSDAAYSLNINSKENLKASAVKGTEFKISAELVGYDFLGWYKGDINSFNINSKPLSTDSRIVYTLNEDASLTALVKEKTYTIIFNGFKEDGVTPIGIDGKTFVYGERLPIPSKASQVSEAQFVGWATSTGITQTANFEKSGEITLTPVWSDERIITFYNSKGEVINSFHFNALNYENFFALTDEQIGLSNSVSEGYHLVGISYLGENRPLNQNDLDNIKAFSSTPLDFQVLQSPNQYAITLTGFKEDGVTEINETLTTTYGDKLPVPTKANSESKSEFVGWKIVNDTYNVVYTNADFKTFNNGDSITLVAVWGQIKTVNYYNYNGAKILSEVYNEADFANFELLSSTQQVVSENITKGYKFKNWKLLGSEIIVNDAYITTIKSQPFATGRIDIIVNEDLITYTVNVKFNTLADASNIDSLTYDVENGFSNYAVTRDGYTLKGIEYNSQLYTKVGNDFKNGNFSLGTQIINQENTEVNVVAVWQSEYVTDYKSVAINKKSQTDNFVYYKDENGNLIKITDKQEAYTFIDQLGGDEFGKFCALEDQVFKVTYSGISNFFDFEGNTLNLKEIVVYYSFSENVRLTNLDITYYSLFNQLEGFNLLTKEEIIAGGYTIQFIFE